jgi:multidrug resistance efflux pump
MSVTLEATPAAAPPAAAPSLWQLGLESQELNRQVENLALLLDSDDDEQRQAALTELEALLAADEGQRAALERKADAYCWVIENLRGQAAYRKQQAQRLSDLAAADGARADRLEAALITVLTRLQPNATAFTLPNHQISSRRSQGLVIEEEEAVPDAFMRIKTSTAVDKAAIKAALKLGQQVPGARLEERRSWSIK